jgi:hypothetical protein
VDKGGHFAAWEEVGNTMKLAADDVQSLVVLGCGTGSPRRLPRSCWRIRALCADTIIRAASYDREVVAEVSSDTKEGGVVETSS